MKKHNIMATAAILALVMTACSADTGTADTTEENTVSVTESASEETTTTAEAVLDEEIKPEGIPTEDTKSTSETESIIEESIDIFSEYETVIGDYSVTFRLEYFDPEPETAEQITLVENLYKGISKEELTEFITEAWKSARPVDENAVIDTENIGISLSFPSYADFDGDSEYELLVPLYLDSHYTSVLCYVNDTDVSIVTTPAMPYSGAELVWVGTQPFIVEFEGSMGASFAQATKVYTLQDGDFVEYEHKGTPIYIAFNGADGNTLYLIEPEFVNDHLSDKSFSQELKWENSQIVVVSENNVTE